jgi:GT2 family glycosyltransferase
MQGGSGSETSTIRFEAPGEPRASIVVLGWKSAPYLLNCLRSVAANVRGVPFEVIVALNAPSADVLHELDRDVEGATLVVSLANRGFSGGCNMGAARARGDYIVLLNDDTLVEPGWLEALVETADAHPSAGAVGGTVLNEDGTLQEAGAVLWRDGRAAAIGDSFLPADMSVVNRVRRVDYCGGEALLVRRSTWEALGGLLHDYYPAYYEDADLCLRIASRGEQVLFQPAAVLRHLRGHSTGHRFKAFVIDRSRRVFVERWADVLATRTELTSLEPGVIEAAIDLAAAPPRYLWAEDSGTGRRPPTDDGSWFARERELCEEYVSFLEGSVDCLEEASGALRSASEEKDRTLAAARAEVAAATGELEQRNAELAAAARDLARQSDELRSTRQHLNLIESRFSYRVADRMARSLARRPAAFGTARKAARRLAGAGRPDIDQDR